MSRTRSFEGERPAERRRCVRSASLVRLARLSAQPSASLLKPRGKTCFGGLKPTRLIYSGEGRHVGGVALEGRGLPTSSPLRWACGDACCETIAEMLVPRWWIPSGIPDCTHSRVAFARGTPSVCTGSKTRSRRAAFIDPLQLGCSHDSAEYEKTARLGSPFSTLVSYTGGNRPPPRLPSRTRPSLVLAPGLVNPAIRGVLP